MYDATLKKRIPQLEADYDRLLLWVGIILLGLGMVMVYSASIAIAEDGKFSSHHQTYFLLRHGIFVFVSLLLASVVFQLPSRYLQKIAPAAFLIGTALLVLVLIPKVGREVNGSQRWLPLYIINLQPSEFMKLFVVIYASDYAVRRSNYMNSLRKGFLPMLIVMLIVGGLLLRQPDFGSFAVIAAIAGGILFLGGINWKLFAGLIATLVVGFLVLIWVSPYRMQRIIGFMDPWSDPFGRGYQLSHALIAFGRGEWFGVGLGRSVEKLFYLPEAHTDFLLAVIAEELGFVGVVLVVTLFVILLARAFAIGREAAAQDRYFATLVAQGIGIWLGTQAIINIGVNVGILPTKGLTLPFLSFGGSAIAANCCALAVLLRIDWENRQLRKGYSV